VTGCGIQSSHFAAPTCSTTNFHRTTSRGFVLAPNRSGAASQQKLAFGAGAQGALAKVSVISRLESGSSSRGSCRWEDETGECGARGGLMPAHCLQAAWQCHQWRHLVAGRVSHDVALQRSAPSSQPASTLGSKATQACQLPPPRHPLKNCPLLLSYRLSLTHRRF
jgi:hypothetical protein